MSVFQTSSVNRPTLTEIKEFKWSICKISVFKGSCECLTVVILSVYTQMDCLIGSIQLNEYIILLCEYHDFKSSKTVKDEDLKIIEEFYILGG